MKAQKKEISTQSADLAADAENAAGEKKPQKDAWDKLGAVAPIISGVLIFIMGGYFTYSFNQQPVEAARNTNNRKVYSPPNGQ